MKKSGRPRPSLSANAPGRPGGLRLAARASVASLLSVLAAEALNLPYPFYSMVAAVIVTDPSPSETQKLGLRRLAGTILGALFGAVASVTLGDNAWTVGFSILGVILACFLLKLQDAAKIAAVVSGIVILGHGDSPWIYAFHRLLETGLGILVALAMSWAFPEMISRFPRGVQKWLGETP